MCKKSIWIFIKFYCFVWCSTKKRFGCWETSNNEYLFKNTFAGYESISFILLGVSMGVSNYFYEEKYMLSFLISLFIVLIYSLIIVMYVWFIKLGNIFDKIDYDQPANH